MKKAYRLIACALVFMITLNVPSYAWNNRGHMAVAAVAYKRLRPAVRRHVDALVKLNPQFDSFVARIPAGTSPANKRMMLFMIAATWPDQIKGLSQYHDDGTHGGNRPPDDPSASQNIGYTDFARHKYWHFVDEPFTQDGTTPLPAVPTPNAETQIDAFRLTLASNSPEELKSYDLMWLLHLVGDIHQPLHCTTRVGSTQTEGDDGGNGVNICDPACNGKLHGFWDNLLGGGDSPVDALATANSLAQANPRAAAKLSTSVWIDESFKAAKSSVYKKPPIGLGAGPFTITSGYRAAARSLARQRVALAGARLAKILNDGLK